ncbi:Hypothetical predicted protein [Paramuricea clavata]|uniref:Uncharacterized protein n=1 Tax=Paramuricea clavata TaxID=317549 RepID=A0A7D9DIK2_PARCT|nr:Hypothetical predicted protein [Paramuricea clavata]
MDGIFQNVDAVLANQRLIIDCLQNNGFLNRPSTRSSVPEAAEQNRINFTNPPDESQHYGAENAHVHGRELTMAELDALNLKKKRGTTDAYFAVLLLKEYTTPEERINCTVYGAGPKSKGLNTNTLMN